jgi:hypothetical protein
MNISLTRKHAMLRAKQHDSILFPLALFLISICIVFVVFGIILVVDNTHRSIFDIWNLWDSRWYREIVTKGYFFDPTRESSVAFFPMYPILVKIVSLVIPNVYIAGILISLAAYAGSLILLYSLTNELFENRAAARLSLLYLILFPSAFFLTLIYTEATFLFLSLLTIYLARKHLWLFSMIAGTIATATRITGILLWIIVIFEWLNSIDIKLSDLFQPKGWRNLLQAAKNDMRTVLILCLFPTGLVLYMLYQWMSFGNPVAFLATQVYWQRQGGGPIVAIVNLITLTFQRKGNGYLIAASNLIGFFLPLALVIPIWRKLGPGYALYVLIATLIPISSGTTTSLIRLTLVLFPIYMILGYMSIQRKYLLLSLILSFGAFVLLLIRFVSGAFVA